MVTEHCNGGVQQLTREDTKNISDWQGSRTHPTRAAKCKRMKIA